MGGCQLKAIEPHKNRILAGHYDGRSIFHQENWKALLGLQFETLVLNNTHQLYQHLGLAQGEILKAGPFFQRRSTKYKGCQIDLLIQTYHRTLYLVEIKFSQNAIGAEVEHEVQEKVDRLSLPRGFSVKPVLVHVNGVSESIYLSRFFAHVVDFSDLLA